MSSSAHMEAGFMKSSNIHIATHYWHIKVSYIPADSKIVSCGALDTEMSPKVVSVMS